MPINYTNRNRIAKPIINSKLTNNGFLIPNIVNQRIRSYSLSEFAKRNEKNIILKIYGHLS